MAGGDFFVVRRGATAVPNSLVHNKELSYAALGLIVLCLSLPAGAKVGYRELAGRGLGQKATRAALKELESLNYRFRFQHRRDGQIRELTVISDVPLSPAEAFEDAERMMIGLGFLQSEIVSCPSHPDFVIPGREKVINSQVAKDRRQRQSAPVKPNPVEETKQDEVSKPAERFAVPVKGGKLINWNSINIAIPPEQKKGLMGKAAMRVTEQLDNLVNRGWTLFKINQELASNPLPPVVSNPPGLLISRLNDLGNIPINLPVGADRSSRSDSPPPLPEPVVLSPEERQQISEQIRQLKQNLAKKFSNPELAHESTGKNNENKS